MFEAIDDWRNFMVASKSAYFKARIALERAIGTILDENHVAIDEVYRGNGTRPPSALPETANQRF
jgi:hypothetical protein